MKKQDEPRWLAPGCILPEAMYTAGELVGRLRWSAEDISLACSKGLRTHVFGDHVYFFGSDVVAFIKHVNAQNYGAAVVSQEAVR